MLTLIDRLVRARLWPVVVLVFFGLVASADARPGTAAARRLRDVSSLRAAAKRHPYTSKIVNRVLSDRARTIDSAGSLSARRLAERTGWVPLGADPELRKVTVATVLRKVRQRSGALKSRIQADPQSAVWDVVFVGAGAHTAIVANTLANLDTENPLQMLTVEASNDIGGNFRDIGSTISRNSANRQARKGARVRRGFGDKNPSEGPWGDPDLSGEEWPELGILADTATVNLFASGSDFLLGTRVERVETRGEVPGSEGWPALHRVVMSDGTTVFANAVARATGLGKPKIAGLDRDSERLVNKIRSKIDYTKPNKVPDILFYTEALKLANLSTRGRDPYRGEPRRPGRNLEKPRPVIAVVGGRDGGRTFLEYIYGQGPAAAYSGRGKVDTAQRGEVGDVEWFVGENGPADCSEFLQTTRSRYLRLAGKVREVGDGSEPRARLNKSRIVSVSKTADGRYVVTDSRGQEKLVDKVIFATGFENLENEDGSVEALTGEVDGLDGERVLAKKVRGKNIYRFGPAAGDDVVAADELYDTKENAGSLYALAPRDRQFARQVLARTPRAAKRFDSTVLERGRTVAFRPGSSQASIEVPRRRVRELETPLSDLVLRSEMMDVLRQVRGSGDRSELSFRVRRGEDGELVVDDFNHERADQLGELISDSALLVEQLEDAVEGGSVEFSVPLRNGRPLRTQLAVTYRADAFGGRLAKAEPRREARPTSGTRAAVWGARNLYKDDLPTTRLIREGYTVTRGRRSYQVLAGRQYDDLRDSAIDLLDRFEPAEGTFYVGVGRSSSPVLAFLQNLELDASYLPTDGLKKDLETLRELEDRFEEVFDNFIPRDIVKDGKTIVLFQRSETGTTLPVIRDLLQRYLASRGSKAKIETVAFSPTGRAGDGVTVIDTGNRPGLQELDGNAAKALAAFEFNRLGKPDSGAVAKGLRPQFREFKTYLAEFMARDQTLDRYLDGAARSR